MPAVVQWLDHVRLRGHTVPHLAKYCLMAFGEAMGISFPVDHPAVRAAARVERTRVAKTAQAVPLDFIRRLEVLACNSTAAEGLQLCASIFCLMVFASLRFSDLRDVSELWTTDTAICGRSLNHKDKTGSESHWATPKSGFHSNGAWTRPLLRVWEKVKPKKKGNHAALFPHITQKWELELCHLISKS